MPVARGPGLALSLDHAGIRGHVRGAINSRCTLRLQGRNELSLQKGVDALEMCGKRQSIVPHCSCMSIGEFYGFRKSFKTIYTALRIANSGVARQDGG